MTKPTVTRLYIGSVVAFVAAIVLGIFACAWAFANGVFELDGPDVVGMNWSATTWWMIGLIIVAGLAVVGGAIGGLVSWIVALLNTARLEDNTWFILLLALGLLSFGVIAMVLYVLGGPDGTLPQRPREQQPMQPGVVPA